MKAQVYVFIAPVLSLDAAQKSISRLTGVELLRAGSMQSTKRFCEFLSGRLLLRQTLIAKFGTQSFHWQLEGLPDGRLRLIGKGDLLPKVGLSHSNGYVACAMSNTHFLGVDIELARPRRHLEALAVEILHPEELTQFLKLDDVGRIDLFYSKWVMKEALGKALGCGIHYPMREVFLEDDRVRSAPQCWVPVPGEWRFLHTPLDGELKLGLALQGSNEHFVSIENVEISL